MKNEIEKAVKLLQQVETLAVLTGAGVSAESGIPTFREDEGLWKNFRAEELTTPEAFRKDPAFVWEWYGFRQKKVLECKPNPAHYTLAKMEKHYKKFTLITQNVDNLHRKAGSSHLLELHGNILKARCTSCSMVLDFVLADDPLPQCPQCVSLLRPHIVWFGESLDLNTIDEAFQRAAACDLFITAGTSALVHPAASLPLEAAGHGAALLEINPETTPITPFMTISIRGKAGEVLPLIWEKIINKK